MNIIEKIKKEIKIIEPSTSRVTQSFGQNKYRKDGKSYKELFGIDGHNGIDYADKTGNTIIAPCNIEITKAHETVYGISMWARSKKSVMDGDREYKLEFLFAHLSQFIEDKGDVNLGFTIARTGNSGLYTSGAHLHFGVRITYRINGGNWQVFDKNNNYDGFVDPKEFTARTYKDISLTFVKDWKSNAVYQLGVDGFYMKHSDGQLFQRLYGKFIYLNIPRLKSELPYSPLRMTIASLSKFKRIFNK